MAKLWGDGKISSPESFWPLPGDDVIIEQMKQEEAAEIAARFAKINAKNG